MLVGIQLAYSKGSTSPTWMLLFLCKGVWGDSKDLIFYRSKLSSPCRDVLPEIVFIIHAFLIF